MQVKNQAINYSHHHVFLCSLMILVHVTIAHSTRGGASTLLSLCQGICKIDEDCKDDLVCFHRDKWNQIPNECSGVTTLDSNFCIRESSIFTNMKPLRYCTDTCSSNESCPSNSKCMNYYKASRYCKIAERDTTLKYCVDQRYMLSNEEEHTHRRSSSLEESSSFPSKRKVNFQSEIVSNFLAKG